MPLFSTGLSVFTIALGRGYNETNFKDDLKKLFNQLGIDKKQTVFLFSAAQIAEEGQWTMLFHLTSFFNLLFIINIYFLLV